MGTFYDDGCIPCPAGTTTYFPGATRCTPTHPGVCADDDGLGGGACVNQSQALPSPVTAWAVTSDGQLHVGADELSDDAQTRFLALARTCVLRNNGTLWLGDCGAAGDMDGARGSGVARLGVINDVALMAVDDATPVLFLATATVSPAHGYSIRAASLYDGTLSTLVGPDAVRLPLRLRTAQLPYAIAVARGTDELLYASGGDVWRERVLHPDSNDDATPFLSLRGERILALAARGPLDDSGMLVLATAARVAVWSGGQLATVASVAAQRVQAAGRRAWYADGGGRLWTTGLPSVAAGCVRGYAIVVEDACAQVGAGRHTVTGRTVTTCPPGTFSVGDAPCAPCPPGTYAPEGAFGCAPCPAGTLAYGGGCVAACPAGAFLADGASSTCTACPPGTSAPAGARAADACRPCDAGYYVNASSGGLCAPCPAHTTSFAGSFRCVVVCPPGQCAPTGDTCLPLTQNWQIITPIKVRGGALMHAVTLGAGGAVFYTDGDQLFHFVDDCGVDAGLASTCQRDGVPLLPPLASPALVRGFAALALARSFAAGTNRRMLYAASYISHAVYRFPIVFQAGSAVLVDVDATRQLFLADAGLTPWRFVGGPSPGFADGPLATARFNMPSELELTSDDARLYVSDFLNARVRVVDLAAQTVATVLGGTADGWRYGSVADGTACASRPLGMGLAPEDDARLYVVQNALDSIGVLDLRARTFAPFCMLDFDNAAQYTDERCSDAPGSRTCMLYMPWDVLASAAGRIYVAATNAIVIIDTSTLACQQIAGDWWSYYDNWGFRDGQVQTGGAPSSLLNRPTKLALDSERGILYVADYSNGALRRIFVDGQCRCAEGALFLPAAQVRPRVHHQMRLRRAVAEGALEPPGRGPKDVEGVGALGGALDHHDVARAQRLEVDHGLAVQRVGHVGAPQRGARALKGEHGPDGPREGRGLRGAAYARHRHHQHADPFIMPQACYNPTPPSHPGQLVACPAGQYALDGDAQCHDCAEASSVGVTASACLLWAAQSASSAATQTEQTYARVLADPEPLGARLADWFVDPLTLPPSPNWDDLFRSPSPRFALGDARGRVPRGGEFVSLRWSVATARWHVAEDEEAPRRLVPGLWYACAYGFFSPDNNNNDDAIQCSTVAGAAFADPDSGGGLVRWHELRLAAALQGGRVLVPGVPLAAYADGRDRVPPEAHVRLWSRYLGVGFGAEFPTFQYLAQDEPPSLPRADATLLLPMPPPSAADALVRTIVGWPAHYACPDGFVWVGVNASALDDTQQLEQDQAALTGQIACLSCLPGSSSSSAGSDRGGPYSCTLCPLGTFAADVASTACTLCPSGTYADTPGASACLACPPNHYTHEGAMHAAACSPCAPGTGSCRDCVEGEYQDLSAQSLCHPCPPGTFSDHANASACTTCALGTYQPYAREGACYACPDYLYTPSPTVCTRCTAAACPVVFGGRCGVGCGLNRYWSFTNGSSGGGCVRCPLGTLNAFWTCALEPDACWEPPPGLYASPQADGTDAIAPCPAGSGANARYDGCDPCAPGAAAPVSGGGCAACAPGAYADQPNATACALCPLGTYAGAYGQTACRACAPGSAAGAAGASQCALCPPGAYAPNASSVRCTPCDAGTYGTVNGSTRPCALRCADLGDALFSGAGASACVACDGGLVRADGSLCLGCGRGQYEADFLFNNLTLRRCWACATGLAQPATDFATNASACARCPGASYASANGTACVACPGGYEASPAGTACVACAVGAFRADSNQCQPCPAGAWAPHEGASACTLCVPGTFRRPPEGACARCPVGTIATQFGAANCTACPAGHQASDARTACAPCAAGFYAPTEATACGLCPGGLTSPPAATACVQCPSGTLLRGVGVCGGCDAGQYLVVDIDPLNVVNPVLASCVRCPAGTFNAQTGATSIDACNGGGCQPRSLVPVANASGCGPCPPGRQSTDGRTCQPCGVGQYAPDGYGGCRPCPPGTFSAGAGTSQCAPCPLGAYANATGGATACVSCAPGAFANTSGQSACARCALSAYAAASGSAECLPRRAACNASQYVVARDAQPDRDNTCADCDGCAPTQFAVYTLDGSWTDLQYVVSADKSTRVPVPVAACPGNTFRPGYYCLDNTWMRGHYLAAQTTAGAASAGDGLTTFQALACSDLAGGYYPLLDYVTGPTFACYVGCRYGLNDTAMHAYVLAYAGVGEDPLHNIFWPATAKTFPGLCLACSTRPCTPFAGRYRPLVDAGCGPACLITPDACTEPDGVTSNDGCSRDCTNLPAAHASFLTGAASTGDAGGCAFACTDPGYHLSDDGTDCVACGDCPPLSVPVPPCYPTSRTADVCRPCPAIVGGRPQAWRAVNATAGRCTYACQTGFYPNPDASLCLPCAGLNDAPPCPAGTFRDVAACVRTQQAPACAACTAPVTADGFAHMSFTGRGQPADADNCSGACDAGYHTLTLAGNAYVADSAVASVWALQCRACTLFDTVPCHGACAPGHYRDRAVASDTTPGACKPCITHDDCAPGFYAPPCGGNSSANVHCMPCAPLPTERVYVPFGATRTEAAQHGLLRFEGPTTDACPSACAPNYVLSSSAGACVRCPAFALTGCPPSAVGPGEPTACDFRYAHWNATPGPMWWQPASTPPSLRGLTTRIDGTYTRAGHCWACALGLGTLDGSGQDLCELLPGYGRPSAMQQERVAIPTLGPDVVLSMREPRMPVPAWLQQAASHQPSVSQRRLLLTLSSSRRLMQSEEALAAVPYGYYNDGTTPYASQCPPGASTRTTGNSAVDACECLPGYYNRSQTRLGGCAPCPVDTYRHVLMLPASACTPCPANETTFGLLAQSACACRAGGFRRSSSPSADNNTITSNCQPCLEGFFCVPCYEGQPSCPASHVWLVPCMPGGTSPPGSSSLLNCTCPGRARLLRPGYSLTSATQTIVPSNDAFYCLDVPPNAVFVDGALACRRGWTPVYAASAPDQLQGCSLCGSGHFASAETPPIVCTPCPVGSYMDRADAVGACTPCGAGLTTLAAGASRATDCTCPAGTRRDPLTQRCDGCALGQYPSPDRSACLACPDGMTTGVGALNVSDCVCGPGYFYSADVCVPCPKGTYAARAGLRAACTSCGVNRVTAGVGARAPSECYCAPGFTAVSGVLCRNSSLLFLSLS